MPGTSAQEEMDEESTRGVRGVLLAREQPAELSEKVKDFLLENAREVTQHIYHFRNSTIWYRTDCPREFEERLEKTGKLFLHIALDLIARDQLSLADDMQEIQEQFPQFQRFQDYPDTLYFPKEARKLEL